MVSVHDCSEDSGEFLLATEGRLLTLWRYTM